MRGLFGICRNNIFKVLNILEKGKVENIRVLQLSDEKIRGDVVFVPSIDIFIAKRKLLNKSKAVVIVFDAAVRCERLVPIELLDIHSRTEAFIYKFKPLTPTKLLTLVKEALNADPTSIKVVTQTIDVIPRILHNEIPSLLSPVLTFLYSVANTDARAEYSEIIYSWLLSDQSTKLIKQPLIKKGASESLVNALTKAFTKNKELAKLRDAITAVAKAREQISTSGKKKAVPYKAISKKFGVSLYDMKYFLSTVKRTAKEKRTDRTLKDIHKENVTKRKPLQSELKKKGKK